MVSHKQQSADTKLLVLEKCSLPSIATSIVANMVGNAVSAYWLDIYGVSAYVGD